MDGEVETMPARAQGRARDRVAAAFLLCLMTVGSLCSGSASRSARLYAASKLVDSLAAHFVVSLPMTLTAMIVWGSGLFWLNGLYLRVTGFFDEPDDPDEPPRRIRGPLEPILIGSMFIALVALFVWFFGFAENPSMPGDL